MSDHNSSGIPPVFLRDIGDLEGPVPPDPPDAGERDDDGDKGPHIRFVRPILMVLSDGSINTDGWRGMLLQGWLWGASIFTAYVLLSGLWERMITTAALVGALWISWRMGQP